MKAARRLRRLLPAALIAGAVVCLAQGGMREFAGTINGTIPIRMKLSISGGAVTGSYDYEKYKRDIAVKGTVDDQQRVRLEEVDPSGKRTGLFEGRFVTPGTIEGTWSSPDGSKHMPFSVTAEGPAEKTPGRGSDPTGTYKKEDGTLEVLSLPGGRLKVHLVVVQGPGAHIGEVEGELDLKGDKAVYVSGPCTITLTFSPEACAVQQKGTDSDCDFGAFVTVEGRYRKADSRPPKFE